MKSSYFQQALNAFQKKQYKNALNALAKHKKKNKSLSFNELNLEGFVYFQMKNYVKAEFCFNALLASATTAQERRDANSCLGKLYYHKPNLNLAKKFLKKSLAIDNGVENAPTRLLLSLTHLNLMEFKESEELAESLLTLTNHFNKAIRILIQSSVAQKDKELLLRWLNKLDAHINYLDEQMVHSAILSALDYGLIDKAQHILNKVSYKHKEKAVFSYCVAKIAYEKRDYNKVIKLLTDELIGQLSQSEMIQLAYKERAQSYEKLKNYPKAFENFILMSKSTAIPPQLQSNVRNNVKRYQKVNMSQLTVDSKVEIRQPVFLLGFPRSGTTLLETILDTQPTIEALSEQPTISQVIVEMEDNFGLKYPQDIQRLTPIQLKALRELYWQKVEVITKKTDRTSLVIDKMPLNTIHIPLIKLLFPFAKFIFALRHPLDVCLSNFQQAFKINIEMSYLTTLKGCFERYNEVLNHFYHCQSAFELNIHFIKYENMVLDLETEMNSLFKFIEITPNANYLEFHDDAKSKLITTPSRTQVDQGIYSSAKYKWKNYVEYIKDYIPIVEKHIEHFGYNLD